LNNSKFILRFFLKNTILTDHHQININSIGKVNIDLSSIRELLMNYIDMVKPKVQEVVEDEDDYQVLSKYYKTKKMFKLFNLCFSIFRGTKI
jgi:hypothetical protein